MRLTFKVTAVGLLLTIAVSLLSLRKPDDKPTQQIQQQLIRQSDSLLKAIGLLRSTPFDIAHKRLLQERFKQLRLSYKRVEWAVEYFDPLTTRLINGPPVPEAELNGLIIQPDGLQVIEQDIYPHIDISKKRQILGLLSRLTANTKTFQDNFKHADLQDWQILDAAKQQVFRVEQLGLNDFDDPLLRNCFAESAVSLRSVQEVVHHYDSSIDFSASIRYLIQVAGFDHFDRAAFITRYANPLTRQIAQLHNRLNLSELRYNRLLSQNAATLFDANAYNRNAFIESPADSATTQKIALGKKLFFDPILSGNGARSCATCHQPNKAFTDGLPKNLDITGRKLVARNTPTLINAALQPAQFYDLRASSLEDQANDVIDNKDEMHGDMRVAIGKLWRNDEYRKLFDQAYHIDKRTAIDTFEVMNALASYVRSLTALNSRFDEYMRGNSKALTLAEINGFNLFMGKAKCSTCHYMPLFNGALPPRYMQIEAEVIGVPKSKSSKQVDPDPGTHGIQPLDFNKHAFKVTTVRNAARTAPYMHNGIYKSLAEVVDFYNKGGGAGMGIKLPNQTLPTDQLHLTIKEKGELVAFIKSLDSN
ncbi:cytochrome c peroxidase [Mucilaginibacter sp. dw_454]|uniref:cytochrome-c peroxidase n=1 Tax=Mucilaginibacter sp. dw_454 TaxID=2720079 RepID=UPI001BD5C90A|nr:cytochrome c peroxidase [Mucilaginibacter sp. dw_454]